MTPETKLSTRGFRLEPRVPDLIEPLRSDPAPPLATTRPSWEQFASSFEAPVRDLPPGQRPRE